MQKFILPFLLLLFSVAYSSSLSAQGCDRWGDECNGDIFNGCALRNIKTSYVNDTYEAFANTKKLLKDLSDGTDVQALGLSTAEDRERIPEENRNVVIGIAYLFMISKEEDNDFHLILGDKRNYKTAKLFSAEISGIPEDENHPFYDDLKDVRDKFKAALEHPESCSVLKKFSETLTLNPIKLTIKGPLLFDSQHKNGGSGYSKDDIVVKTKTGWEIHPVSDFELLQ